MQIYNPRQSDFSAIRPAMQGYVDRKILAGVSSAILHENHLVYHDCVGWADQERQIALNSQHLFRIFSNTKLITSIAVLLLVEQGKIKLDDVIEDYLPQLANRRVLRPDARDLSDTEAARCSITVRHLLSHTSGLGYGLLDHGSMLFQAYTQRKVLHSFTPLSHLIDALEDLPLNFHPGTAWEYSIASDVLGRLVEVVSAQKFDHFITEKIFKPLGMQDTGFYIPVDKHPLLTAYYAGTDPHNLLGRELKRLEKSPYPEAYLRPVPRLSGGGGLVSSLPDMLALIRSLMPGAKSILRTETIQQMMQNQLPAGMGIAFPGLGHFKGKGFGLGGAITVQPGPIDPPGAASEFEWGGIAGTHWWISPRHNLAGILMTQKQMSFWHPFSYEFKKLAYQAVGAHY